MHLLPAAAQVLLDGTSSDDVSTVRFGLDGVDYEIDLNPDNAERLRKIYADHVTAERLVGLDDMRGNPAAVGQEAWQPKPQDGSRREKHHEKSRRKEGMTAEAACEARGGGSRMPFRGKLNVGTVGRHIAHRLVHDGETVLDVPAKFGPTGKQFQQQPMKPTD